MQKRTGLALIAGVTSAGLAATGIGVAVAASSATTHTLKINSVQTAQTQFSRTDFADTDKDKDVTTGKVIGFDIVDGTYDAKTQSITVDVAASLKGGILYLHGTGTFKPNKFTGTVTGGTGAYKGAKGTVTGTAYGKDDDNEHLTITYH